MSVPAIRRSCRPSYGMLSQYSGTCKPQHQVELDTYLDQGHAGRPVDGYERQYAQAHTCKSLLCSSESTNRLNLVVRRNTLVSLADRPRPTSSSRRRSRSCLAVSGKAHHVLVCAYNSFAQSADPILQHFSLSSLTTILIPLSARGTPTDLPDRTFLGGPNSVRGWKIGGMGRRDGGGLLVVPRN